MDQIPIFPLLVTFLHEMGHALAALITGGHVVALQIKFDGSGVCTTSGGIQTIVLAGGYLGSVFFGNVMLYVGIRHKFLSRVLSGLIAVTVVLVLIWFSTISSFVFTALAGGFLLFLFMKIDWSGRAFLLLAGAFSVLYVLHDYQIGPSSDLQAFASVAGLTPLIWMYVWLGIAAFITATFVGITLKGER